MSELRKRFLNRLNLWLGSLIAILTGTACDPVVLPTYGVPPVEAMYGPMPAPMFVVSGEVHNEAKEPLHKMQVVIDCNYLEKNDTLYTHEGTFGKAYDAIPQTVTITVNDTTNVYQPHTETKWIRVSDLEVGWGDSRALTFDITLTKKAGVKEE